MFFTFLYNSIQKFKIPTEVIIKMKKNAMNRITALSVLALSVFKVSSLPTIAEGQSPFFPAQVFDYKTTSSNSSFSTDQYERVNLGTINPGELAFSHNPNQHALTLLIAKDPLNILKYYDESYKTRTLQLDSTVYLMNPMDRYNFEWSPCSEIIVGTDSSDCFDADRGNDIIYGGGGNDKLIGGDGSDTFVFNGDFGADTIYDNTSNMYTWKDVNRVILGDLTSSDVNATRTGDSLILQSKVRPTDSVTICGFFNGNHPIQEVQFTDKTQDAKTLIDQYSEVSVSK